ncbi:MAG: hypothetical protein JXR72_00105 [Proteobacteria bacterium]|nr:hypothetical protein [Pseudomonadota bacterium]
MKLKTLEILLETAYHEAGHAVAGIRLGLKILGMSLIPDDDYDAAVFWEDPLAGESDPEKNTAIEKEIILALAGPVAVSRYRKEPLSRAAGSDDDVIKALSLMLETGKSREELGRLVTEAHELMHDPMTWNAVEALVKEAICRFLWAGWAPGKKGGSQPDLFEGLKENQGELFDSPGFEPRMRGEEIEAVVARADEAFKLRLEKALRNRRRQR